MHYIAVIYNTVTVIYDTIHLDIIQFCDKHQYSTFTHHIVMSSTL